MKLAIYTVTYASHSDMDGELFTETKVFLDEEKAKEFQRQNIEGILDCDEPEKRFEEVKDDTDFSYYADGWSYRTTLEEHPYEFYFNEVK